MAVSLDDQYSPSGETGVAGGARSYRNEREFGLMVGGISAALGVWFFYRGKTGYLPLVLVGLGSLLILLGGVLPRALVLPNQAWMRLGAILSFITTPVVLAVVFFGLITPIGTMKRLLGWDPLRRRANSLESYWVPYSNRQRDRRHYEKMF